MLFFGTNRDNTLKIHNLFIQCPNKCMLKSYWLPIRLNENHSRSIITSVVISDDHGHPCLVSMLKFSILRSIILCRSFIIFFTTVEERGEDGSTEQRKDQGKFTTELAAAAFPYPFSVFLANTCLLPCLQGAEAASVVNKAWL